MATPDIATFNKYIGNGATTQFSVGFPYIDTDFIHVYIKRNDSGQEEVKTTDWEWVNETTIRFPATGSSEAILADGEVLVVQRETPTESEFTFANQKRLFPEDVMKADDLEMQILQEQARDMARSVKVNETSSVDPNELVNEVERIYQSTDNIDTVAQNISDVGTVASNISYVGVVANDISNVNIVAQDKDNIDAVAGNKTNIDTVSANKTNIDAVAGNKTNIDAVAGIKDNINTVANNIGNIESVASNISSINAVNENKNNINSVNNNKTNIDKVANNQTNINTTATNISAINNCSSNMSAIKDAPNQANRAKQYADQAQAVTEGILNETQITNCITEIPQNIKLELNNGTLTLKAGSKLYVPNGSETFTEFTTSADKTATETSTGQMMLFYNTTGNNLGKTSVSNCASGPTTPTVSNYGFWYDTTNNLVKRYLSGSWTADKFSFPIAIITISGGAIKSIDQVFNGFGYIGSTIFALPGVKGLIPNGRNEDGSLRNIEFVVNKVTTSKLSGTFNNGSLVYLYNGGFGLNYYKYDNKNNCLIHPTLGEVYDRLEVASVSNVSGSITSFTTKTTFHAVDYYDLEQTNKELSELSNNVSAIDSNNMKLSGDQTVRDNKTFTGTITSTVSNVALPDNSFCVKSIQASGRFADLIGLYDTTNNKRVATIRAYNNPEKRSIVLGVSDFNGSVPTGIEVAYDSSNNLTIKGKTPSSATDNSTQLATTEWVRNAINKGNLGIPNYGARVSFSTETYTPTSNGIIVVKAHADSPSAQISVNSDGFIISRAKMTGDTTDVVVWAIVRKGEAYDTAGKGTVTRWFIPFR